MRLFPNTIVPVLRHKGCYLNSLTVLAEVIIRLSRRMSPLSTKSFFETVPIDPFKVRSLVLVGIVQMSHVLTFVFFLRPAGLQRKV